MSKRISHEQLDQAIWLHLRDQDQHPFDSYQLRAMANYSMVKARIQAMRKVGRIRFLHFVARQHRPAHVTNPLTTLTLHTLTRWLTPWRTIRQLEAENRQLQHSNERLVSMVFLACSKNVAKDRRLRRCRTHGQQPPNAWGCPECVRELREELDAALELLETAREALRRLQHWGGWPLSPGSSFDFDTTVAVADWLQTDMTGPLPPLPEHLTWRKGQAYTGDGL